MKKVAPVIRKKDGFNGQMAIILPNPATKLCASQQVLSNLYITDIGFYPRAQYHFRERDHGSPQHILIYCTDGSGWAIIEGKELTIKAGEFLIIPANTKHKYGSDEKHPWSIYWVHFKGSDAARLVELLKKEDGSFTGSVTPNEDRKKLFHRIYEALGSGYSISHLFYINMLFSSYIATFCFPQFLNPPHKEDKNKIDQVISHMQEQLHTVVSLKELAGLVHMSSSHFSALFKKKTGYPPLEYFNHLKIQRACQYLEFTDLPVKELCYKLGLNDPFYFSRLFSKYMGEAPVSYRKRKSFV